MNTYCPQAFTTTLEEAERLMHQDVLYRKKMKEEDDYPLDTFCYYISEIPMGLLHYDRECLSERMYDGEGKLIDRSYCCSRFSIYYPGVCDLPAYDRHPDETFRGRNAEQIRFQKGDIVEVYRGDEVKLAIVVGTPLTTEWIWERNQAVKDKRGLDELPYDETDDSYTVIDGPGYEYHDHVPSLYVFAPHYHVPLYLQRRFKGYLEKAEKSRKKRRRKTGSSARLTIAVSATRNRLRSQKSAVVSSAAKSSRHPKSRITSLMSRLQPNVPSVIPTP